MGGLFKRVLDQLAGGTPVERSPERQAAVEAECRRLTLYHFPTCPFCARVRRMLHALALPIEQRDIRRDRDAEAELVAGGGVDQVPCLRIEEPDGSVRWMYESGDIARYLEERFGSDGD